MAFKTTSLNHSDDDGRRELTVKEFKRWLMKFDSDKDGRISKKELREVVKATGGWFSGWKGKAGIKSADKNGNGFVDECEIQNLIQFAQKELEKQTSSWTDIGGKMPLTRAWSEAYDFESMHRLNKNCLVMEA
ncbi:hypothetical protein LXL04_008161 [Taraxacum kok-saghyz]